MSRFLMAALLLPSLAAASDLKADSHVDSVVVYQSSARVTRVARVSLPVGDVRLLLEGVTDHLQDDSLRVQGTGTAKARVYGISVDRITGLEAAAEEARATQRKLEQLQDEDQALEDQRKSAAARRDFVTSLRSTYAEERSKNLAVRAVSGKEWSEITAFVAREDQAAAAVLRQVAVARRELAKKIQAAKAEADKFQAKQSQTTKTIALELRAERAGSFEVEVSYVVPNASWRPVWDARLLAEKETLDLALYGTVEQTSGEDWGNVKLALSTAQPARSLYVPELGPHYLEKWLPQAPAARSLAGKFAAPSAVAAELRRPESETSPLPDQLIEIPAAEIAEGLLSATFTAPRRESVEGAGRARKIYLTHNALKAELTRIAAPRQDPTTFLAAQARNDTGASLLPGVASIFLGEEFVGRSSLPMTPPGGEVKLAFGADERIKIERKVLERNHETSGLINKDDVIRYRIRTLVKNLYRKPVSVRVLDLVPVSRDEAVKVKLLDGSTPPAEEDPNRPGVRSYLMTLDEQEEKALELRYEVRFAKGATVAGLE